MISMGRLTGFTSGLPCTGKKQHLTRADAETERARLRRNGAVESPGRELEVYQCWHCRLYHVGHTRPRMAWDRKGGRYASRGDVGRHQERDAI